MIRRLLLLNGLAALGAVINHASGWGFTAMIWWAGQYMPGVETNFAAVGSPSYYLLRVLEQIIMFSIPAFLFVSGFFMAFATGRKPNVEWSVVGMRIKNLVIPYLIWTFVILALAYLDGARYSVYEVLVRKLIYGQTAPPFYYVPLLIQLYVLAPLLLIPWAKRHWQSLLVVSGLMLLAIQLALYPVYMGWDAPLADTITSLTPAWFFPSNLFWFCFGLAAGFNLPSFKQWIARMKWVALVGAGLFVVLATIEWELLFRLSGRAWIPPDVTLLDSLYAICFLVAFMAFERAKLPAEKQFSEIGTRSYGIYLVHAPVQEYTARILYHVLPAVLAYQILLQPILIVVGLGVPLLLMTAVDRSPFRKYYQYLFGK